MKLLDITSHCDCPVETLSGLIDVAPNKKLNYKDSNKKRDKIS